VELDDPAAVDEPEQTLVIEAGERAFPIAAEQVEWAPAERRRVCGPTAVEEAAAVVDEAQPAPCRHVAGWFVRIEPRKAFGPGARRASVVLDDGGPLLVGVGPPVRNFAFLTGPHLKWLKHLK
jgi:hypothetical protein